MQTPQTVIVEPPSLDPDVKSYWLSALTIVALRTLIVWAAIAILIPEFGITYWMVYVGLVGFAALRGPGRYALVHSANRVARTNRLKRLATFTRNASDDALLHARSS